MYTYTYTYGFGQLFLSRACPGVLIYPVTFHWRNHFSSSKNHHLLTASWLWVGFCVYFPFSKLGFCVFPS